MISTNVKIYFALMVLVLANVATGNINAEICRLIAEEQDQDYYQICRDGELNTEFDEETMRRRIARCVNIRKGFVNEDGTVNMDLIDTNIDALSGDATIKEQLKFGLRDCAFQRNSFDDFYVCKTEVFRRHCAI